MPPRRDPRTLPIVGWREWVALPDLGVERIKVKVDTGARSSAIHAFSPERVRRGGRDLVRFSLHPLQRRSEPHLDTEAELIDVRDVRSSMGHTEQRFVIVTNLTLLGTTWPIELFIARRDHMGFRMLLGREAIRDRFLVDPRGSFYDREHRPRRKKVSP
ncbi:MAG: RimK/LysX family protein [Planctomycetota bacterium]